MLALLAAGLPSDDKAIVSAGEYLRATFDPAKPEPWEPTSFTALIDPPLPARLDFRHFTTPWAIAALCLSGSDLGDPVVFQATRSLLRLQTPSGAWRCALAAPDDTPIWAIHDAVYALRVVLDTSSRNLSPISLTGYTSAERTAMRHLAAALLRYRITSHQVPGGRRRWLQTAWMSGLSVIVVVVVLAQVGLFRQVQSSSQLHKILATVIAAIVTTAGAVSPLIVAEEYRIRRTRAISRKSGDSD